MMIQINSRRRTAWTLDSDYQLHEASVTGLIGGHP